MRAKVTFAAVSLFLVLCLSFAYGQGGFTGPSAKPNSCERGGFTGPSAGAVTVAEAKELVDDTPVILAGAITRSLGNERYTFADNTGTITVEIESKVWGGISISEKDKVEISGEIDRERGKLEIEVKSIRKL
ncbi:MAG: YgiW/YdeI family stress tolerance OB fold protein [Chitinispirillales bacterium]|nr:YgiW/YdeI family stress tolerance OB fold protein [Chitinispirillales bacterium]